MSLQDSKSTLGASARTVSRRNAAGDAAEKTNAPSLFEIGKNVVLRVGRHNLSLVAAGVAFCAMTAIFPAIAALVSVYGLFADPRTIERQIASFSDLLPANSLKLLTDALENFAGKSQSTLNVALIISIGLALWSAKAGVSSLMTGLNIADGNNQKTRTKQSPNRCGTRLIKPWLRAARCRTQRLISPIHRPRLLRAMLRNRWTRQKASPRKRKSGLSARSLNKRELAPTTSTT